MNNWKTKIIVSILMSGIGVADVLDTLIPALIQVESSGNTEAIGDGGAAVGCLQLHKIYVDDVNRIAGGNYSYTDRLCQDKSIEMTRIYLNHYGKGKNIKDLARIHNGGPKGHQKEATLRYWKKVRQEIINQKEKRK